MNPEDIKDIKTAINELKKDLSKYIYLNENLKDNKEVALYVSTKNGLFVKFMSEKFKDDKDIALNSVARNVFAINEISERLKNDMDVIKAAIKHDTRALKSLDPKYKEYKELALISLNQNSPHMNVYSPTILQIIGNGSLEEKTHALIKAIASDNLAQSLTNKLFDRHDNVKKTKL